jgi:hypothetical protein
MSPPLKSAEGRAGEASEHSCPSARCEPGATLLGNWERALGSVVIGQEPSSELQRELARDPGYCVP